MENGTEMARDVDQTADWFLRGQQPIEKKAPESIFQLSCIPYYSELTKDAIPT